MCPHRRKLGATGDDGDFGPAARQPCGQVAADGAGAVDADPQDSNSSAARDSAWTPRPMQASSGW